VKSIHNPVLQMQQNDKETNMRSTLSRILSITSFVFSLIASTGAASRVFLMMD